MAWVHAVVDVPAERHGEAAAFWGGVLGWPAGRPWDSHPELSSFEPPAGTAYVHLQRVGAAPGVHLDIESAAPDVTLDVARDLGAELVAVRDRWRTLRSPGGLPFCVVQVADHEAPGPLTFADGHRARLVQVCVDAPAPAFDRETAFWRELLGGRWAPSGRPEFGGKWHDDAGSPLQLLFQRLDEPDGPVRAHLDHGTDDLDAEVRRVIALGARDVGRGAGGWHVLRDPVGQLFCVTRNSPETTTVRDLG